MYAPLKTRRRLEPILLQILGEPALDSDPRFSGLHKGTYYFLLVSHR